MFGAEMGTLDGPTTTAPTNGTIPPRHPRGQPASQALREQSRRVHPVALAVGRHDAPRDAPGAHAPQLVRPVAPARHRTLGARPGDPRGGRVAGHGLLARHRSEEHTSELQSLMRTSYAVF